MQLKGRLSRNLTSIDLLALTPNPSPVGRGEYTQNYIVARVTPSPIGRGLG